MSRSVILFLAANPIGFDSDDRTAFDQEYAAIERELKMTRYRDQLEIQSKWAVTVDDLMRHMAHIQPDIVHFSGHGGASGLVLTDDRGHAHPVAPDALARVIRTTAERCRLAVLNACYSEDQARTLRDAVGCAIGMTGAITDDDAEAFSIGFYRGLGNGRSVGNAFDQAVAALKAKNLRDDIPHYLVKPGVDIAALTFCGDMQQPASPVQHIQASIAAPPGSVPSTPGPVAKASAVRVVHHSDSFRYDLFLTYSSADKPSARALYDQLQPDLRVFLEERSLRPGDDRNRATPAAQHASRGTVVLLSSQADIAWYLSDEVITAIAMHRAAPQSHALIPVQLEPTARVPCNLNVAQIINAPALGGLPAVAARLREHIEEMRRSPSPGPAALLFPNNDPASNASGPGDRIRLHDRMSRLRDALFEDIIERAGIDRSLVASRVALLATRVLDVVQLAAVDRELCHRLSAELDRRAPWTRE